MTVPEAGSIYLDSGLWIDRPDAGDEIEARRRRGLLSAGQAERLAQFARDGYAIFPLGGDPARLDGVVAGVEQLWRRRPGDIAYAYDGPARRMSHADEARERRTRYRIHDLHSHLEPALALYLEPRIHEWMRLILDEEPVAIQSLFFEFGSEQILHRDPVVVPTAAKGHLFAAWIALEDIGPDCGALIYVPGSHRLPYYEFAPGQYMFNGQTMGEREIDAGFAFEEEQCARHGLERRLFTASKGEVLLWHASLRHGGAPVTAPGATRRSLVVHFSSRRTYPARSITISEPGAIDRAGAGGERLQVWETRRLLERDGCAGFDNPLRGEPWA